MGERRWFELGPKGASHLMSYREVLAEMGTEAVIEWLEDKGYVIRHEDIIGDYLEGGE
jgi:hypothetical protein